MDYKIQINNGYGIYFLDTDVDTSFDITREIQDIQDITTRSSSYTKTISLPDTAWNREKLLYINNLNFETNQTGIEKYLNINSKLECWLYVRDISVLKGYAIIDSYDVKNKRFNIRAIDTLGNLYSEIGDKTLPDLDLSSCNIDWTISNIVDTWTKSSDWGVHFPLIDFNRSMPRAFGSQINTRIDDYYPAIYAKTIFSKIITDTGNSIGGTFMLDTNFNNLIIPITNGQIAIGASAADTAKFKVSRGSNQYIVPNNSASPHWQWTGGPIYNGTGNGNVLNLQRQGIRLEFDDDTTAVQGDNENRWGNWTVAGYNYVAPRDGIKQSFVCNLEFFTSLPGEHSWLGPNTRGFSKDYFELNFYREFDPNTGAQHPEWNIGLGFRIPDKGGQDTFGFNYDWSSFESSDSGLVESFQFDSIWSQFANNMFKSQYYKVSVQTAELDNRRDQFNRYRPLYAGEKVRVVIRRGHNIEFTSQIPLNPAPTQNVQNFMTILGGTVNPTFATNPSAAIGQGGLGVPGNYVPATNLYNLIADTIAPNGFIDINTQLKTYWKDIKQKDFILSITRMFNLFYEQDPNTGVINIYSRNDYYNSGSTVDLSDNIKWDQDFLMTINIEKDKRTKFTYTDDSDYLNKTYSDAYKTVFGTQIWELTGNQYLTAEKEVKIIFAPTPMVRTPQRMQDTSDNFVYSGIYTNAPNMTPETSGQFKPKMRILWRKRNLLTFTSTGRTLVLEDGGWGNQIREERSGFPYAGHLDDPINPNFDLLFGPPEILYYPSTRYTSNNLFNLYWENHMQELTSINARMVTVWAYLTPTDYINLRFNNTIQINYNDGSMGSTMYFRLMKIDKYNINGDELCELTLLKADRVRNANYSYYDYGNTRINPVSPKGGYPVNNNMPSGIGITRGLGIGLGSNINSNLNSIVIGNNNTGGNIIGASNSITGINNNMIIGNYINTTGYNTIGLMGTRYTNYINKIDGGENVILNFASGDTPNKIDGGENVILNYGSSKLINKIGSTNQFKTP